jgi:hypothetical protein
MGSLTYDGTVVHLDDRVLTHLQIVIVQKFLKEQSFLMSWKDGKSIGDGRSSIWMTPSTPLYFKFLGSRTPTIDKDWLVLPGKSAESSTGLIVTMADGSFAESSPVNGGYPGNIHPEKPPVPHE